MAVLGLPCRSGFSLVAVPGLLTVVASLVAEHGVRTCGLQQLWLPASRAQSSASGAWASLL